MRAIPIDVFRAFIAVVDSRGFTRAAEDLGRSQPTISLQVKRLEELIETPLFEKNSRLALTRAGEICLRYGRKILAEHDEMLELIARERSGSDAIRIGLPSELAPLLVPSLAEFSLRSGGPNFEFTCEMSETLLERLRSAQLDVVVAMSQDAQPADAVASWRMPMSWICAGSYRVPNTGPVQLITTPEGSLYHHIATQALQRAGRKYEVVCKSANFDVLRSAVEAGYGVAAFVSGLAPNNGRTAPTSQIGPLPDVTLALYARPGSLPGKHLIERMVELLSASPAVALAA